MAGSGESGDLANANLAASTASGSFFAQMRMRPMVAQLTAAVLAWLM